MIIDNILSEVMVTDDNIVSTSHQQMTSGIQESLLHQEQSHAPKLAGTNETSCDGQLSFNFFYEKTGN